MTDSQPSNQPDEPAELPSDVEACHALILALIARIAELEKHMSRKNRALFGPKSAKVDADLLTGAGKELHEQTTSELAKEQDRLNIPASEKRGGGRAMPPSNVEQTDRHYHLDPEELVCACGGTREVIGTESASQLEYVRSIYESIRHILYKYKCKKCNGAIVCSKKPYQAIDKGIPGPGLLAKVATDKLWLHLPLYRQEKVFRAMGLSINRSSMSRWLREVAFLLEPLVNRMKRHILESRVLQSDATTIPVLQPGRGRTHRAFAWVYRGDALHPYVCYDYSRTEHSLYPERILNGFKGVLQTDGTNKYNQVIEDGATSANCWAHVHCYFEDAWKEDAIAAEFPMGVIRSLFDIERLAANLSDAERQDIRDRIARPKVELLQDWLFRMKAAVMPKTKLGEAIAYTLNRWPALLVYLDAPFVEISNNASERSIKPLVLSRKNWLFAGSDGGGQAVMILMSLIETCKRLGINPFDYLKDVLTRFPSAKTSQIDDFLPDRWLRLKTAMLTQ